jgi:hypothetical protein
MKIFPACRKKLQVNLQMTSEQSSDVFSKMLSQPDISDRLIDVQSITESIIYSEPIPLFYEHLRQ